MVKQGVRIKGENGSPDTLLSTWDWISCGGLELGTELSDTPLLNMISNYDLKGGKVFNKSNLYFGPAAEGYRVFWTIQPNNFSTNNDPFRISGDEVSWSGSVLDAEANPINVKVRAKLTNNGKSIEGETTFDDGEVEQWSGELSGGLPLTSLNIFTGN